MFFAGVHVEDNIQGAAEVELLDHAGQVPLDQGFWLKGIDPAEYQGNAGEEEVPVLGGEEKGVVVRGDDDVEVFVDELFLIEPYQHAGDVFVVVALGVHVLDL